MSIPSIFSNSKQFGRTSLAKKGNRGRVPQNAGFTPPTAGFMIIELLISVLIMSAMSTVVLSANSNMSARLQTDNLAHQIALSIREAQTRALSATAPMGTDDASQIPGYGVYINMTENNRVEVFSDTRLTNVAYYPTLSESVGTTKAFGSGFVIDRLSAVSSNSGESAAEFGGASIYFHRPRPDAQIFYSSSRNDETPSALNPASQVSIRVQSSKWYSKTIKVTSTGQISVQ